MFDLIRYLLIGFAFVGLLMVLFSILRDLFRDPDLSGIGMALWVVALIFLPFLTAAVYLIARGQGMAEREYAASGGHGGGGRASQAVFDSSGSGRAEYQRLSTRSMS